ncbi:MAG TPA: MarR family transcriptional regulator [Terriglobia bacterium]|nr:MarR family transcriptional regulator [Terriglobia bacterium]
MNSGDGTRIFIKMCADWIRMISPSVARQDPEIVIRFLELNNREEGISQSELARKLKISQSAVSKRTVKLLRAGYVSRRTVKGDGRVCLTRTTAKGKRFLAALDGALSAEIPHRHSRRRYDRRHPGNSPLEGQQEFDFEKYFPGEGTISATRDMSR